MPLVTRGEERFSLQEDQATCILPGMVHILENRGKLPLEMVGFQAGSYWGADGIEHLEDEDSRRNGE